MDRKVLFKGWPGCTNHGCVVRGKTKGMHTNGSCKCIVNASKTKLNILQSRLSVLLNDDKEADDDS